MADDTTRDELLTRLQTRVAQLEATQARQRRRGHPPRRFLSLALVALLAALLPLSLLAANPFTDLVPGSVHNPNVDAIYNAGITTGCDPNVSYCPTDLVTRQEMASFLARTAGIGGNPPVANAKTAQTAGRAQTADTATNATNAQNAVNAQNAANATTAGHASTAANASTATNADKLDGYDANGLVRAASTSGGSGSLAGPCCSPRTNMAGLRVTAPDAGYLLVVAHASITFPSGGGTVHAGIFLDNDPNWHSPSNATRENHLVTTPTSGTHEFMVTYLLPVSAGEHAVTFWGHYHSGALSYANATLNVLYVPFNGSGT